jgi:hypothetical protein
MTWNHRVVKRTFNDEVFYGIHEVYYDDDGTINGCTMEPVAIQEESVEDLEVTLTRMLQCAVKPVLDFDTDIPSENKNIPTQLALEMLGN